MKILDSTQILQALAKGLNKYCMSISMSSDESLEEQIKAAPYLNLKDHCQVLMDNGGILVFDTLEEMDFAFNQTIGDDGPTDLNPYNGPAKVYALTCDYLGQLLNENT